MPKSPNTCQLNLYCSREERLLIEAAAKAERRNISNYLVMCAMNDVHQRLSAGETAGQQMRRVLGDHAAQHRA